MKTNDSEFLSCPWIEAGLTFHYDSLRFCCQPVGLDGGMPKICDFSGGRVPMDVLAEKRRELTAANNAGEKTACTGCRFLKKGHWKRKTTGLLRLVINNYTTCNLRCRYCYTVINKDDWELGKNTYSFKEPLDLLLDGGQLAPNAQITWGGGEPTIIPEFEQCARRLLDLGYTQYVFSNCLRFSDVIREGLERNLMMVECSVDAGTPEQYKTIKGKDAFNTVWEHLGRYARAGRWVTAKYILMEDNSAFSEVDSFFEQCLTRDIPNIHITPDHYALSAKSLSDQILRAAARLIYLSHNRIEINQNAEAFGEYAPRIRNYANQLLMLNDFFDKVVVDYEKGDMNALSETLFGEDCYLNKVNRMLYKLEKDVLACSERIENLEKLYDNYLYAFYNRSTTFVWNRMAAPVLELFGVKSKVNEPEKEFYLKKKMPLDKDELD